LVLDKNLIITGVNPSAEKLFGRDRRTLVGQSCDDLQGLNCSLLSGQTTLTIGERVLDMSLSPLTVHERRSYGYLVTLRDITAHKLAEEHGLELAIERERSRLLVNFVHNAGHEFRTPLSVIQSSLYLLEKITDPAGQAKNRQRIQEQSDRIMALVDSLIQIARLDYLRQLDLKPTNVNSLIEVIAERWRVPMIEKGVEFHLDLTPALVLPLAHEEFAIALHHLIDNALRHTPRSGQVIVRTGRQCSQASIEVTDTGEGIGPEALPRIFQRLYRADEARTLPGFGLGLPIVQRIIALHHGVIEAESAVGQGSRFRILLPLNGSKPHDPTQN
jgi:signal transduction histidine kinase